MDLLLKDREAFLGEHRRCGDLDGGRLETFRLASGENERSRASRKQEISARSSALAA